MTVKELKKILTACNDDAVVFVVTDEAGSEILRDHQVFQHVVDAKGTTEVFINVSYDKWEDN